MEKAPRGSEGGKYDFLYEHDSPENIYYRWRVFAFSQGDTVKSWRVEPFLIFLGGRTWRPPPSNSKFSQDKKRVKPDRKEDLPGQQSHGTTKGGDRLISADRDTLEDILRDITRERESIKKGMIFCMDHANCSSEIALCLYESLTLLETELNTKIARLYLLSDILYNSSSPTPCAWSYRASLEKHLPRIFEHWGTLVMDACKPEEADEENVKLEKKKKKIQILRLLKKLLRIWTSWAVYSQTYLQGLEASLFRTDFPAVLPEKADDGVEYKVPQEAESLLDEELDGEPLDVLESRDLSKYPLSLRPRIMEWLSLDKPEIERVCMQKGVASRPTPGAPCSFTAAIDRLACREYYLNLKVEAEDAPLQIPACAKELLLLRSASDKNTSSHPSSPLAASSVVAKLLAANPALGPLGDVASSSSSFAGEPDIKDEASSKKKMKKEEEEGEGKEENLDVKSESSDDIFDLPPEEEEDDENIFKQDQGENEKKGDKHSSSSLSHYRYGEEGGSSKKTRGREEAEEGENGRGEDHENDEENKKKDPKKTKTGHEIEDFSHPQNCLSPSSLEKTERKKSSLIDRMRMREVELQVTQQQIELEKLGVDKDEITLKCDELRKKLLEEIHKESERDRPNASG
ncbi:rrm domain-containing, partial [Cystoisospora suis]